MKYGLDTSVVVRMLIGEPADLAEKAKKWLVRAKADGHTVYVSDIVALETYHVLNKLYKVPKADVQKRMIEMFESGYVQQDASNHSDTILRMELPGKPGFADHLIEAGYSENMKTEEVKSFDKAMLRKFSRCTLPE